MPVQMLSRHTYQMSYFKSHLKIKYAERQNAMTTRTIVGDSPTSLSHSKEYNPWCSKAKTDRCLLIVYCWEIDKFQIFNKQHSCVRGCPSANTDERGITLYMCHCSYMGDRALLVLWHLPHLTRDHIVRCRILHVQCVYNVSYLQDINLN